MVGDTVNLSARVHDLSPNTPVRLIIHQAHASDLGSALDTVRTQVTEQGLVSADWHFQCNAECYDRVCSLQPGCSTSPAPPYSWPEDLSPEEYNWPTMWFTLDGKSVNTTSDSVRIVDYLSVELTRSGKDKNYYEGCTFDIKFPNGNTRTATVNENGKLQLSQVPVGQFTLKTSVEEAQKRSEDCLNDE